MARYSSRNPAADWRSLGGVLLLSLLGLHVVFRQEIPLLLASFVLTRLLLMAALLWDRVSPVAPVSRRDTALGWSSAAMPYFYESSPVVPSNALEGIFCLGLLLATWGYFSLGRAFGVSPAFRFRVETGAYRYFSHPIYLGYAISETSWLLLVPTLRNVVVFAISLSLYVWRANREEVVLYRFECESGSG